MKFNHVLAIKNYLKKETKEQTKPPIAVGITKKNIIKNACDVTKTLYNW